MGNSRNRKVEEGLYKISWLFAETIVGNVQHMRSQLQYFLEQKELANGDLDQLVRLYVGRVIIARHLERISYFAFAQDNKISIPITVKEIEDKKEKNKKITQRYLRLNEGILKVVQDLKMNKDRELLVEFRHINEFVKEIYNWNGSDRKEVWNLIKKVVIEHHDEDKYLGLLLGWRNLELRGPDKNKPKLKRKRRHKKTLELWKQVVANQEINGSSFKVFKSDQQQKQNMNVSRGSSGVVHGPRNHTGDGGGESSTRDQSEVDINCKGTSIAESGSNLPDDPNRDSSLNNENGTHHHDDNQDSEDIIAALARKLQIDSLTNNQISRQNSSSSKHTIPLVFAADGSLTRSKSRARQVGISKAGDSAQTHSHHESPRSQKKKNGRGCSSADLFDIH